MQVACIDQPICENYVQQVKSPGHRTNGQILRCCREGALLVKPALGRSSGLIAIQKAISQADNASAPLHHALIVGHEDQSLARAVQIVKHAQDFLA